jgi:hypothetical protein
LVKLADEADFRQLIVNEWRLNKWDAGFHTTDRFVRESGTLFGCAGLEKKIPAFAGMTVYHKREWAFAAFNTE